MTPEKEIPEDWIGFGSEDDLSFGCLSFDLMDSQDLMSAADRCVAEQVVAQDQDTPAVEYKSIPIYMCGPHNAPKRKPRILVLEHLYRDAKPQPPGSLLVQSKLREPCGRQNFHK